MTHGVRNWHGSCSNNLRNMYLRDVLARCRDLEMEAANIYSTLAQLHSSQPALSCLWAQLAQDEEGHSATLAALLTAREFEQDRGPFLIDVPPRIEALARLLSRAYATVNGAPAVDHERAIEMAYVIESSELNTIFDELIELCRSIGGSFGELLDNAEGAMEDHRGRLERLRTLCNNPPEVDPASDGVSH